MESILETDRSLLSETPSDVKPYYLKVTTHDNKVTKLAVDKIEEVTVDGATLYKVTAKAPDLVQRTADQQFSEDTKIPFWGIRYFNSRRASPW